MAADTFRYALDDAQRLYKRVTRPRVFGKVLALRERPVRDEDTVSLAPVIDRRAVFIHIPKCAGITVNRTLYGCRGGAHMKLALYRRFLSAREFETFFKFTFVRNPWDRVVSAYHFLGEGGLNERDRRDAERTVHAHPTFEAFVEEFLGAGRAREVLHFRPQHLWLTLPGRTGPQVDFIGRFERFEEDFTTICERLGVRRAPSHANPGRSRPASYREAYTDRTAEIVGEAYARDIELFGYSF